MRLGLRIRDQHHDGKGGPVGRGREPFVPVDDIVSAILDGGGCHPDRIRPGILRLGHREAAADVAVHQRAQPALLLGLGAELHEDFHVSGIGSLTIEDEVSERAASELLAHERVLHEAEAHAAVFFWNLWGPKSQLLDPFAPFPQLRQHALERLLAGRLKWVHLTLDELPDSPEQLAHLVRD